MSGNPNSPYGAQPIGTISGSPWAANLMHCLITASDSNAMGIGDPVVFYGDADIAGFTPTVTLATAGKTHPVLGFIVSFDLNPDNLYQTYRTASVARYCSICVATPDVVFEMQAGATVLAYTVVGFNAELKAGSVNTATGLSGWYMDSGDTTAPDADATGQLQILGLANRPNNDITSAYAVWRVRVNLPQIGRGVVGV